MFICSGSVWDVLVVSGVGIFWMYSGNAGKCSDVQEVLGSSGVWCSACSGGILAALIVLFSMCTEVCLLQCWYILSISCEYFTCTICHMSCVLFSSKCWGGVLGEFIPPVVDTAPVSWSATCVIVTLNPEI